MNLLDSMFGKTSSVRDIRVHLKEIEREQRRKRLELDAVAQNKQLNVQEAIAAKKAGRQEKLRDIFREMRQLEIDYRYINNDLRRLSLTMTALSSLARRVEILERGKNRQGIQRLVMRLKKSSIQKAIDSAEVSDDTFNEILEEILGEEEVAAIQSKVRGDSGFAEFDRAISEMAKVEEAIGDEEEPLKSPGDVKRPAARTTDDYQTCGDRPQVVCPPHGDKPRAHLAREPVDSTAADDLRAICPDCSGAGGWNVPCDNGCDHGEFKKRCPNCNGEMMELCPDCRGKSPIPCPQGPCQLCRPPLSGFLYCDRCGNEHYVNCTNKQCKSGYVEYKCDKCRNGYIWKKCERCGTSGSIDSRIGGAAAGPSPSAESPAVGARLSEPAASPVSSMESKTCSDCGGARGAWVKCDGGCNLGKLLAQCPTCEGKKQVWCKNCNGQSGTSTCPICGGPGCQSCSGTGLITRNCPICQNTHYVKCPNKDCVDGYVLIDCGRCQGKGLIWKACQKCQGTGTVDTRIRGAAPGPSPSAESPAVGARLSEPVAAPVFSMESKTCPDCGGARGAWVKCDGGCNLGKLLAQCPTCEGKKQVWCKNCNGQSGTSTCPICGGPGCQSCSGTGLITRNCPTCQNTHYVKCPNKDCVDGFVLVDCGKCQGKGQIWKACQKCEGTGTIETKAHSAAAGSNQTV